MLHRMKRLAVLALLAVPAGCGDEPTGAGTPAPDGAMQAQGASAGARADLETIQAIVATLDATWGVDPVRYSALYADAEWVGPNGAIRTDLADIQGLYTFLFNGPFAGTTRQSIIRRITFLNGTTVLLDIDARVTGFSVLPPGVVPWQPGTVRGLERNILVKRAGEWRIIFHQQTAAAPGV